MRSQPLKTLFRSDVHTKRIVSGFRGTDTEGQERNSSERRSIPEENPEGHEETQVGLAVLGGRTLERLKEGKGRTR